MSATIRNAIVGDEGLLARLNALVQDVHLEKRPADFKATDISALAAWYRSLLEASTARAWIAEQEGVPIGYILAVVYRRTDNPFSPARQWWEIDQIAVGPKFRRQGVGRALMLKAISEAKRFGITKIEATSWAFNQETHALLRQVGFVPMSVRFELSASPM